MYIASIYCVGGLHVQMRASLAYIYIDKRALNLREKSPQYEEKRPTYPPKSPILPQQIHMYS